MAESDFPGLTPIPFCSKSVPEFNIPRRTSALLESADTFSIAKDILENERLNTRSHVDNDDLDDVLAQGDTAKERNPSRRILSPLAEHMMNAPSGVSASLSQLGIAGLNSALQAVRMNPHVSELTLGFNLWDLVLNLGPCYATGGNMLESFQGPLSQGSLGPHDISHPVPSCYKISRSPAYQNAAFWEKPYPFNAERHSESTLFYLFYNYGGDMIQILAADQLYKRNWRFHKSHQFWITHISSGATTTMNGVKWVKGLFCYFDHKLWKKITKELHINYAELEGRPIIPNQRSSYAQLMQSLVKNSPISQIGSKTVDSNQ